MKKTLIISIIVVFIMAETLTGQAFPQNNRGGGGRVFFI